MKIIDNLCTLLWIWWPTAHISHPKNTTLVMVSSFLDDPPCHLIFWYFNIKNIYQYLSTATFALQRALFSAIINKLLIPNTIKVNFLIPGLVSGQGGGKATPPIIRLTPRQWDLPIDSKVQQYYLRFGSPSVSQGRSSTMYGCLYVSDIFLVILEADITKGFQNHCYKLTV